MDIDALHSALLSITVVSEKVRAAEEVLSAPGGAPSRLGKFLCEAENDLRMAQATLGGELGFSLCPRCWPPELVATDLDGKFNCPVCGRISHEQAAGTALWVKRLGLSEQKQRWRAVVLAAKERRRRSRSPPYIFAHDRRS